MAIEHRESENLLRDGTVYQPRLLMRGECSGRNEVEVFFGFRSNGGWSLYFDEEPVLQFTASGKLRRLYQAGAKYLAVEGRLVELRRDEVGGRVRMQQAAIAAEKHTELLEDGALLLSDILAAIKNGSLRAAGFFPEQGDAPTELLQEAVSSALQVAASGKLAVAAQAGANQ